MTAEPGLGRVALALLVLLASGCADENAPATQGPEEVLGKECAEVVREHARMHDVMLALEMDSRLPGSSMTEEERDAIVAEWRAFSALFEPLMDAAIESRTGKVVSAEETREVLAAARRHLAMVRSLLEPFRSELMRLFGLEKTRKVLGEGAGKGRSGDREE